LAGRGLAARFVIDRLGQALEVAGLLQRAVEAEGLGGRVEGAAEAGAQQNGFVARFTVRTPGMTLEPGGEERGLTVALRGAGADIGVMTPGDRERRIVHPVDDPLQVVVG